MERKIKITDFTKKKEDLYTRKNELIKIFGIAGTGKTTFISNLLKDKLENSETINNVLILSYTHTGKNEIIRKLLNEDLGKFNYDSLKYDFYPRVNKPLPPLLKNSDIGVMTIYSFIHRHLTNLKYRRGFSHVPNILSLLMRRNTLFEKSLFREFVKKNNLNIDANKLANIFEILKDREEEPLVVKKLEESIKERKINLTEDEILFLILFLENNIFQHKKTIVYDYINNRKYWLLELIKSKWESLFDIELDIQKLFDYKDLIIQEFPQFNLNSYLVFLLNKIDKNYILNDLISKYDYVIVDEAQDTPDFLLSYIFKLVDADYLYLVGDPAQNIYFDLGYSELFAEYEEGKNILILNKVYRYSENLLNLLREEYPKFKLLYKVTSVSEHETFVSYLKNKKELLLFIGQPDTVLIKNTNNTLKVSGLKVYPLFVDMNRALPLIVHIIYNYDTYVKNASNPSLLKGWIMRIIKKYFYLIAYYLFKKCNIEKSQTKEKIFDLLKTTKEMIEERFEESIKILKDLLNNLQKNSQCIKKKNLDKKILHRYVLFSNTYQSKGRSFNKVVYYNEFGKYFLMRKEREGVLYWNFYHSTLKYVGLTRARKLLLIYE